MVAVCALFVALAVSACARPAPAPTPTPIPPTPTAVAAQAQPTRDPTGAASPADVENAFLSNIDDLIAEAADLTVTPCPDLTQVTVDNPNLLASVHGFAAAAKRLGANQAVLNTDAVKNELSDLDHSIGELDAALSLCGIKQP
jgi:ABC-type sugar transport system substrate-binding protein